MMARFLLLLLLLSIGSSVYSQNTMDELLKKYNTGSIPYISVEELRMSQLKNEVLILDTRSKDEYAVSHIENAIFVGYNDFDLAQLEEVSKSENIVVYCSVGIRSENIGLKLKKAGYHNIHNLFGGIFEWKNNDFPLVDSKGLSTEKVHAYSRQWSKWLKKGEKIY